MAGEWIKMECATPDKPEVLALTVLLGWDDPDLTVGKLFRLWRWFDTHTTDGNARGVSAALLDKQVGVTGFIEKVEKVGWLSVTSDGVSLSNFDYHTGATAKNRAQTAKRVANHKENAKGNAEGNAEGNAHSVSEALAREEKRREERDTPLPPAGGVARFEDFWDAWPKNERKQDKVKCAKKWKASAFDLKADLILADIAVKRQTQKWQDGFVEAPLVYLNGKRWEDGVTPGGSTAQASIMSGVI